MRLGSAAPLILGIESSCDETSAAVSLGDNILANVIASQKIHESYGGVVPELASRAHQQEIIPVVNQALTEANVQKNQLNAIAYCNGPGLMGSLLVGASFSKSFAYALGIPTLEVNHMQAHVMSHFAHRTEDQKQVPEFPFLCLTVSGGHTQIVLVESFSKMVVMGQTQDDAAGEAFDKIAKYLGLPYPGGPMIDRLAKEGNPKAFTFPHPKAPNLDFSFSGLKTAVLYFYQKELAKDPSFLSNRLPDLCASVQNTIIEILLDKLESASKATGLSRIAIAGGVAANSGLRKALKEKSEWNVFIPPFEFCTDNAGMVAVAGHRLYLESIF